MAFGGLRDICPPDTALPQRGRHLPGAPPDAAALSEGGGALFCPAVWWPAKPASRAPDPRRPPEVTEAPKRPSVRAALVLTGNVSGDVFPSPEPCRFHADSVVMVSSCAVKRQHGFQRGRRLVELGNLSRFRPVPGSECPCPQKLRSGHPDPQCGGPGRRGVWEVPRS